MANEAEGKGPSMSTMCFKLITNVYRIPDFTQTMDLRDGCISVTLHQLFTI